MEKIKKFSLFIKKNGTIVFVCALIAFATLNQFFLKKTEIPKTDSNRFSSVDVLVPLFPISKNEPLSPSQLRLLPIYKKDFTKRQILDLVTQEDFIENYKHIRAKKDIPPNKPLFWSDFKFQKQRKKQIAKKIHYGAL